LLNKKEVLEPWHVTITIRSEVVPNLGFKLTGEHGDKGVVCKRVKREHMPRDEYGNIADFVVDPMSTGARMNPSRKYEWYYSTSPRDFGERIKDYFIQKYIDEGKVTVHLETAPTDITADKTGKVTTVKAVKAGKATEFTIDGVFVFIGLKPNTQFLEGSGVELDEQRLIKTDRHLATNLPGVYASGDVRSGATDLVSSVPHVSSWPAATTVYRSYNSSWPTWRSPGH
jgi:hypothetical protein